MSTPAISLSAPSSQSSQSSPNNTTPSPLQSLAARVQSSSQTTTTNTQSTASSSQHVKETNEFLNFRAPVLENTLEMALYDLGLARPTTALERLAQAAASSAPQTTSSNANNESSRSLQRSLDDLNAEIEKCRTDLIKNPPVQQKAQLLIKLGNAFASRYKAKGEREVDDLNKAFSIMKEAFEVSSNENCVFKGVILEYLTALPLNIETHATELNFIIEKIRELLAQHVNAAQRPNLYACLERILGYNLYRKSASREYRNEINEAIVHLLNAMKILPSDGVLGTAVGTALVAARIRRNGPSDFNAGKFISDLDSAIATIQIIESKVLPHQRAKLMQILSKIVERQVDSAPLSMPASSNSPVDRGSAIRLHELAENLSTKDSTDELFYDLAIKKYEDAFTLFPSNYIDAKAVILTKIAVAYARRAQLATNKKPSNDLDSAVLKMQKAKELMDNGSENGIKAVVLTTLAHFLLTQKKADPRAAAAHYDSVIDLLNQAENLTKLPMLSSDRKLRIDIWLHLSAAQYLKAKLAIDLPDTLQQSQALLTGTQILIKYALDTIPRLSEIDNELHAKLIFNQALVLHLKKHLASTESKKKPPSAKFKDLMNEAYMLYIPLRAEISKALNLSKDDIPLDPAITLPRSISNLQLVIPQTSASSSATQSSPTTPKHSLEGNQGQVSTAQTQSTASRSAPMPGPSAPISTASQPARVSPPLAQPAPTPSRLAPMPRAQAPSSTAASQPARVSPPLAQPAPADARLVPMPRAQAPSSTAASQPARVSPDAWWFSHHPFALTEPEPSRTAPMPRAQAPSSTAASQPARVSPPLAQPAPADARLVPMPRPQAPSSIVPSPLLQAPIFNFTPTPPVSASMMQSSPTSTSTKRPAEGNDEQASKRRETDNGMESTSQPARMSVPSSPNTIGIRRPAEDSASEQPAQKKRHVEDLTVGSNNNRFSLQSELKAIREQIRNIGEYLSGCTRAFEQVVARIQVLEGEVEKSNK